MKKEDLIVPENVLAFDIPEKLLENATVEEFGEYMKYGNSEVSVDEIASELANDTLFNFNK